MNAITLVKAAKESVPAYHRQILNGEICYKLELAYVAQWLDAQDPSVLAKAAVTAVDAIVQLRQDYCGVHHAPDPELAEPVRVRNFTGPGHLEATGYIPEGSASERETPRARRRPA